MGTLKIAAAIAVAAVSACAETVVLQNFTLIDGTGKSPVSNAAMVITDGRIRYVGPKASLKPPQGASTQDLAGKFVMPGIINLHGHLANTKGLAQDPSNYTDENLRKNLDTYAWYGVTSVVSMGTDKEMVLKYRAAQRAGRPDTTRIFTALRGFTGAGGYPTTVAGMKGVPFEVDSPAQAQKDVAWLADKHVDIVKIWVDDHFGRERKIPLDLSKAIIDAAHEHNLKVGAHIFYLQDAQDLVDRGLNVLLHSVRDKDVDDRLINTMKQKGAWMGAATLTREMSSFDYANRPAWLDDPFFTHSVTPDVVKTLKTPGQKVIASDPRYATALAVAKRNLKKLVDSGVKYGFGTDTGPPGRFPGYFEHVEMQLMNEAGLTPMQIIQAASKNNAEFLGVTKDLGTLENGKWADLIVLAKNPLDDIKNTRTIDMVMIAGKKVNR